MHELSFIVKGQIWTYILCPEHAKEFLARSDRTRTAGEHESCEFCRDEINTASGVLLALDSEGRPTASFTPELTAKFKVGRRVIDMPSDDHGEIVASCVADYPDCWAVKFDKGGFAHVLERDLKPE